VIERITFAGSIASELIESGAGCVIAVFDRSFYIGCDKSRELLCCIGTSQLVHGPVNVTTSLATLPSVAVNARWYTENEKLYIDGVDSIDKSDYQLTPRGPCTNTNIIWPDSTTVKLLSELYRYKQSDNVIHSSLRARLQHGTNSLTMWLQSGAKSVPNELSELIGCGPGLTPSGDDILIGALVALHYVGEYRAFDTLANWVRLHAPNATNRISLAHLHAACRAMAVAPLHQFITALFSDKENLPVTMEHFGQSQQSRTFS